MATSEAPPVPDPTILTTAQLHREITLMMRQVDDRFDAVNEILGEKFRAVGVQLDMVEKQRGEQKTDTKAAVDAALIAQKEAVREQTIASERAIAKSEAATSKQLEQLGANFVNAVKAVTDTLADVKSRVDRAEAGRTGGRDASQSIYLFVGFVGSLALIGGTMLAFLR